MDERILENILARLQKLESDTVKLRTGVITDVDPISVEVGSSGTSFVGVRCIGPVELGLDVIVAMYGNSVIILGGQTDDPIGWGGG